MPETKKSSLCASSISASFGFYEKRLCVLLFLAALTNPLPMLQSLVTQFIPPHHCKVQDVYQTVVNQANLSGINVNPNDLYEWTLNQTIPRKIDEQGQVVYSKCTQYNVSIDELLDVLHEDGEMLGNKSTVACHSMHYEGVERSAVTEFDMICERASLRPLLSSFMFGGMIVGSIFGGFLSDRYGRRYMFLIFTYIQFINVFALSFVNDVISYSIISMICGAGNLINFAIAAVLGSEFIDIKKRGFVYFSLALGYGVGYMLIAPVSYFFRDWRWFLRFTGLLGIGYIPYWWLIDETPQWLKASGRFKEAKAVLDKMARVNGNEAKALSEVKITDEQSKPAGVRKTIVQLASEPILVARAVIVSYQWFVVSVSYYALALNNNNLSGSRFTNLIYAGLMEMLAAVLYYVAVEKWGRCSSYIGSSFLLAACVAANCLLIKWSPTAMMVCTMGGKLMASIAWSVIYVHTQEIFPTKTRQTAIFIGNITSKVGAIISPFIVYANDESSSIVLPSLITASMILLSSVLTVFLPETASKKLPQTVEEATDLRMKLKITCCAEPEEIINNSSDEVQPLSVVSK